MDLFEDLKISINQAIDYERGYEDANVVVASTESNEQEKEVVIES